MSIVEKAMIRSQAERAKAATAAPAPAPPGTIQADDLPWVKSGQELLAVRNRHDVQVTDDERPVVVLPVDLGGGGGVELGQSVGHSSVGLLSSSSWMVGEW